LSITKGVQEERVYIVSCNTWQARRSGISVESTARLTACRRLFGLTNILKELRSLAHYQ